MNMQIKCINVSMDENLLAHIASISHGKDESKNSKALLELCFNEEHNSIFRHAYFTFRVINCPLFIVRQWNRHEVGNVYHLIPKGEFGYVEQSFRYTKNPTLSKPNRLVNALNDDKLDSFNSLVLTLYEGMINDKVPPEVARMVLPMTLETSFIWTVSVEALITSFFPQRLKNNAQLEIREVAKEIFDIFKKEYPIIGNSLYNKLSNNKKYKILEEDNNESK